MQSETEISTIVSSGAAFASDLVYFHLDFFPYTIFLSTPYWVRFKADSARATSLEAKLSARDKHLHTPGIFVRMGNSQSHGQLPGQRAPSRTTCIFLVDGTSTTASSSTLHDHPEKKGSIATSDGHSHKALRFAQSQMQRGALYPQIPMNSGRRKDHRNITNPNKRCIKLMSPKDQEVQDMHPSEELRLNSWGGRKVYPSPEQDLPQLVAGQVERDINWAGANPPPSVT